MSIPSFGQEAEQHNPDLKFAQVLFVTAIDRGNSGWTFETKVRHADEGWDHYAHLWEVVDPESETVLGRRELLHPHVNEQPFVRSLSGVSIPQDVKTVIVRAKCNKHGFEGKQVLLDLSASGGEDYTVKR